MSEEKKLLLKWIRRYVAREGLNDSYRESISLDDVYRETMSLLAQPEQEPKIEFRGLRTNGDSYSQEPVAKSIADRINTPTSLQDLNDCIDWALTQQGQEPLSDEVLYLDRLRKKVEMMKKEWIEYNLTDNLINDFFVCARKELADEGVESE